MASQRLLLGLIGSGVGPSLTPPMLEREAAAQGVLCLDVPIDTGLLEPAPDLLESLVASARLLGFRGLNVTHPWKQEVIGLLDELSPAASTIGAVNTVVFEGERSVGHNTDATGFEQSFRRGLPGAPLGEVVLLGAGGAGAAVAAALLRLGAVRLLVCDPVAIRMERLTASLRSLYGSERAEPLDAARLPEALAGAHGLVNASPVGMTGHPGLPLPAALLRRDLWVADVVYRPLETELLREARAAGCPVLDGGGMAVFQAVAAFELFSGRRADSERMLEHFRRLSS